MSSRPGLHQAMQNDTVLDSMQLANSHVAAGMENTALIDPSSLQVSSYETTPVTPLSKPHFYYRYPSTQDPHMKSSILTSSPFSHVSISPSQKNKTSNIPNTVEPSATHCPPTLATSCTTDSYECTTSERLEQVLKGPSFSPLDSLHPQSQSQDQEQTGIQTTSEDPILDNTETQIIETLPESLQIPRNKIILNNKLYHVNEDGSYFKLPQSVMDEQIANFLKGYTKTIYYDNANILCGPPSAFMPPPTAAVAVAVATLNEQQNPPDSEPVGVQGIAVAAEPCSLPEPILDRPHESTKKTVQVHMKRPFGKFKFNPIRQSVVLN